MKDQPADTVRCDAQTDQARDGLALARKVRVAVREVVRRANSRPSTGPASASRSA